MYSSKEIIGQVPVSWSLEHISARPVDIIVHDWILTKTKGMVRLVSSSDDISSYVGVALYGYRKSIIIPLKKFDTETMIGITGGSSPDLLVGLEGSANLSEENKDRWHEWCIMNYVPYYSTEFVYLEEKEYGIVHQLDSDREVYMGC